MIINPYRFAAATNFGNASRDFDGTADYVDLPSIESTFQSSFSIAFWIKLDDGQAAASQMFFGPQTDSPITTNANRAIGFVNASGNVTFSYYADGNQSRNTMENALSDGAQGWVHYVWTVASGGNKVYINGIEDNYDGIDTGDMTGVTMGNFEIGGTSFPIGCRRINIFTDIYRDFTSGLIADFRIYSKELSATEASDLSNGLHVADSLFGWWLGNDDNLLDLSGNDRHGYGFAPLPDNATFGDASRNFSGPGGTDQISVASSADQFNFVHDTKVFSVACWVRLEAHASTDAPQHIVGTHVSRPDIGSGEVGWAAFYDNANATKAFTFLISAGDAGVYEPLFEVENQIDADGEWHHVAWTCDATTLRFYLDGVEAGSIASGSATTNGNADDNLLIGRDPGFDREFNGYLADLRIYDVELSGAQIATIIGGTNITGDLQSHYLRNTNDETDAGILNLPGTEGGSVTFHTADAGTFDIDGPLD